MTGDQRTEIAALLRTVTVSSVALDVTLACDDFGTKEAILTLIDNLSIEPTPGARKRAANLARIRAVK
jgi:hypothetical protein